MENNIIVLVFKEEPFGIGAAVEEAFKEQTKAESFLETVLQWQDAGLVKIEDAVIVLRDTGGDVKIKQTKSLAGKYALGGSGIGLLAGLLLGGPIGGLIGGAAIGAITGKMKDYGIDDDFIKETSEGLTPNSSALFLLGKSRDREKLLEELKPFKALVATTTLSEDGERELRKVLSREE
ncbi:MAG: DUF1269 domain-containing protein [Chloroflexota bacterium]|nr:MAG: DUF1269 domain-containing protein [Chloroflexota bacterium]